MSLFQNIGHKKTQNMAPTRYMTELCFLVETQTRRKPITLYKLTEWFLNIPCLVAFAVNLSKKLKNVQDLGSEKMQFSLFDQPGVEPVVTVRCGVLVWVEPSVLTA